MPSASEALRNPQSEALVRNRNGAPDRPVADGSRPQVADGVNTPANLATIAAIGICAYILTDLVYLTFHSAACISTGCQLVEITSSAVRKLHPNSAGFEPFWVHSGGSLGNLTVFLLAWALSARESRWPASLRYFIWLAMVLNGLVAGGQIFISNAFDAGDWAMLTQNWSYRILWKLLFTAIGFGIALFAFLMSRERIEIFLGRDGDERRALLPLLAGVPYLAGGVFLTATAALSVNNKLESVIVAAVWTFGLTAWLLIFAGSPHLPRPSTPHRALAIGRNLPWLAATAILATAFAAILGPGIWLYS